jgi:hypothetical protein
MLKIKGIAKNKIKNKIKSKNGKINCLDRGGATRPNGPPWPSACRIGMKFSVIINKFKKEYYNQHNIVFSKYFKQIIFCYHRGSLLECILQKIESSVGRANHHM